MSEYIIKTLMWLRNNFEICLAVKLLRFVIDDEMRSDCMHGTLLIIN